MTSHVVDPAPGLSFVSSEKRWVRFVVAIGPEGDVHYQTFDLRDGKPLDGISICSQKTLFSWADRMATSDEEQMFDPGAAVSKAISEGRAFRRQMLERVSDQELLEEVRRRGLNA